MISYKICAFVGCTKKREKTYKKSEEFICSFHRKQLKKRKVVSGNTLQNSSLESMIRNINKILDGELTFTR